MYVYTAYLYIIYYIRYVQHRYVTILLSTAVCIALAGLANLCAPHHVLRHPKAARVFVYMAYTHNALTRMFVCTCTTAGQTNTSLITYIHTCTTGKDTSKYCPALSTGAQCLLFVCEFVS